MRCNVQYRHDWMCTIIAIVFCCYCIPTFTKFAGFHLMSTDPMVERIILMFLKLMPPNHVSVIPKPNLKCANI